MGSIELGWTIKSFLAYLRLKRAHAYIVFSVRMAAHLSQQPRDLARFERRTVQGE
jgi:hypothetical protein